MILSPPLRALGAVVLVDHRVPLGRERRFRQAGLINRVVALVVGRRSGLDIDPVRRGGRVLHRAGGVDRRVPDDAGFGRVESGGHRGAAILQEAIVVDRQLVLRAHLPRHARLEAADALRIDALIAARERRGRRRFRARDAVERVGRQRVEDEVADRPEDPDAVLLDRATERALDVVQLADAVAGPEAAVHQVLRDVVALEALSLVAEEQAAARLVAAVARNHVESHAAAGDVGRRAARRVDHLLAHRAVEVALHRAVDVDAVDHQPVYLHRRLRRAGAVRRHVGLLHGLRSADVRLVQRDAGHELTHALDRAAGRNRVEGIAVEHLRLGRALDVHDRRRAGDGQRLFERADLELDVDGHREVGRQLEPLTLDRRETRQHEAQDVVPWPQVDEPVAAGFIGHHRSRFLDQRRTGRLHGDAGQYRTRGVLHNAGQDALCVGRGRPQ